MFVRLEETERSGVQKFLQAMQHIPPVQIALAQLQMGAPLPEIAAALSANLIETFDGLNQQIGQLQREVLHKTGLCEDYQKRAQEWRQDPLQEQLARAEQALEEKVREAMNFETNLNQFRRESGAQAQEIQELREQVSELNRLVAKQHRQLSNLIGSDTP